LIDLTLSFGFFDDGRRLEAIGGSCPESDGGGGSEPESDGGKLSIAGLKLDASYQLNALDARITFLSVCDIPHANTIGNTIGNHVSMRFQRLLIMIENNDLHQLISF
jgi:hypothetical protein